jgi:hypothetical protein
MFFRTVIMAAVAAISVQGQCIPCNLNVIVSPADLTLVEGQLKSFQISLPAEARRDIPAVVTLKAGYGLALSRTTCAKVPLTIEWGYPSLPSCVQKPRTIELAVKKGTTCTGSVGK